LLGLALRRWIDLPVIVLVNIVMDFEPLIVMLFGLNYPTHGYVHTLLFGSVVGLLWAVFSFYFLKGFYGGLMKLLRLEYQPRLAAMLPAGILGVWLHVLLDSVMHPDVQPFWPMQLRPLLHIISLERLHQLCEYCVLAAFVLYIAILLMPLLQNKIRRHEGEA
jgi:membrane-bound metal-dependent hydrolase YbcI (DUF457 family)